MALADVEFVDRYTGTVHEGKPHLRGCWGDCEAMGFYPVQVPVAPEDMEPGKAYSVDQTGNALEISLAQQQGRILNIDEDGWAWIKCADCNGTGTVGRRKALRRLPRFFKDWYRMMRYGGPEDDRWGTIKFAMRYFPRELFRTFTWELPVADEH